MAIFDLQEIVKALLLGQLDVVSSFYQQKDDAVVMMPLLEWATHIGLVWSVGLILGWMLPRPRIQFQSRKMPLKLWLGRMAILWNGLLLCREVWYRFCSPGTFRALLKSLVVSIRKGIGMKEAWKIVWEEARSRRVSERHGRKVFEDKEHATDPLDWHVSLSDLSHFKKSIGSEDEKSWEKMFEKSWEGCSYTAWRRRRPNGRTEYKSVTLAENATCHEFMDFYLDDDARPKWDGLVSKHELLESAHETEHRCQVVRWVRSFPFAFISDREYIIARRVFQGGDGELYGITKSVEHPAAPRDSSVVRMHDFYSMWRSRTVSCPKGSSKPACETTLLHYEDFGIPENLARFAVRHGMGGFVANMVPHMNDFILERRTRCKPTEFDHQAYGIGITPKFPSSPHALSSKESISTQKSEKNDGSTSKKSRKIGYMFLVTGIAVAFSKGTPMPRSQPVAHDVGRIHHHHSHLYKRRHRHIYKGHVFHKVHKLQE